MISTTIFALVVYLMAQFSLTHGAKILAITMPQGRSHFMSMLPLCQKLASQGHEVSAYYEVYKPEPEYPMITNRLLTLHSVGFVDHSEEQQFIDIVWHSYDDPIGMMMAFNESVQSFDTAVTNHSEEFSKMLKPHWDFVLVDSFFSLSGMAIALQLKKPYAIFATSVIDGHRAFMDSLGWSPPAQPPVFFQQNRFHWDINLFYDRLYTTYDAVLFILVQQLPVQHVARTQMARIGLEFDWSSYFLGSQLTFYDYPDRLQWPMPIANEFKGVGGFCADRQQRSLPAKLQIFVSDPTSKGTIVVSFGTMVRFHLAPKNILNAFIKFLSELKDYRIIWSFDSRGYQLPKHIHASTWIPQADLLNHPNTVLFLSHGGLKSFKEALCSETAVVFMPMFAEQLRNAYLAKWHGFAEEINKFRITEPGYLMERVRKVLDDRTYHRNVKRVKDMWTDRPIAHMDEAAFFANRLIKWKKMPEFFFRRVRHLNTVQHWNLDFISVLLFAIVLLSGG